MTGNPEKCILDLSLKRYEDLQTEEGLKLGIYSDFMLMFEERKTVCRRMNPDRFRLIAKIHFSGLIIVFSPVIFVEGGGVHEGHELHRRIKAVLAMINLCKKPQYTLYPSVR